MSLSFLSSTAEAGSRTALLTGFGSAASRNTNTFVEGPLMVQLKLDTDLSSNTSLGLEHTRTIGISDTSSVISATTMTYKYHFLNTIPGFNDVTQSDDFFHVTKLGFSPYFGVGLGVGSSSSSEEEDATDNAISLIAQAKVGSHWLFSRRFGFDTELSYALPLAGDGEIYLLTLGFGIFYNF